MSQIGIKAMPSSGNDIQSFIDFLQTRKKKNPQLQSPVQSPGSASNASVYGGSTMMSPAMRGILGF